ncbi:Proteasome subunit beta type-1 [Bonamia ostreae]|uniref:Proteasome subunit beta type-1 n=1 Tax=Bonamia ostreae TaxID=126728 RepID=A0ABV2AFH6_9EUKA
MHSDRTLLLKVLRTQAKQYEFENFKPISGAAVASMLSTELYSRRFFPYYVFSMAATLNEDGNGALYGYDAVGCAEKVEYSTSGSGGIMAHSFLDNQVGFKTHPANKKELTLSESIELVKKTFLALSERDIFTGDKGEICVLTADGLERVEFELRKD